MAESRGGGEKGSKMLSFATKKARRVQQKMLEKVGKTEKTTDGNYTEFVVNFNKQQLAAARLQKELQKYSSNMKAMSVSTKSLLDVWMEYYEPQWTGQSEVVDIVKNKMLLWEDLLNRVNSDMIEALQLYMSKFPETKKVAEKRERKIVDYDYAKRVLEDTRQKQKVTDVKIQQAEDAYHQAKQAFDEVTDSLYEELPALYDSRIEFYSKFFSSMTSVEAKFHEEMAKLDSRYNEIMCDLAQESESGMHTTKKERSIPEPENKFASLTPSRNSDEESPETSSVNIEEPHTIEGDDNCSESFASAQGEGSEVTSLTRTSSGKESPIRSPPSKPQRTDDFVISEDSSSTNVNQDESTSNSVLESKEQPAETPSLSSENELVPEVPAVIENIADSDKNDEESQEKNSETISIGEKGTIDAEKQPESDETDNQNSVLGKRVATHPYTGEDEDELSFEKGDIILVIAYEPQEDEEDEGWNMGIVESTGKKGLFPENFTKTI